MSNLPPPLPPSTPPPFTAPPMPPASPKSETVAAVIDNIDQKTGVFSKTTYRMVVTDQRLVFALQQKNGVDYLRQEPGLTLAENPANFAIPLEELVKIETYSAGMDDSNPDTMIVITRAQKTRFIIHNYHKVQKQLKEILGNCVS